MFIANAFCLALFEKEMDAYVKKALDRSRTVLAFDL